MKIPFSYRQPHLFKSVLVGSILGHILFFAGGNFFTGSPRYNVEQAPSSVEVIIIKKPITKQRNIEQPKIFSATESPSEERIKKTEKKQEKIERSIFSPIQKGAVTKPQPVSFKNTAPVYPELAREREWEGTVMLKVLVGKDGKVTNIAVYESSGHKILDESALKAVKTWQFVPAKLGELTFSSSILIPVKFVLVDQE